MDNVDYLIVTTGVTAVSLGMTCTNYKLNGFSYLSAFTANIISIVMSVQNTPLITTAIIDLILESYLKTSCF
jgi:hypothetical protein